MSRFIVYAALSLLLLSGCSIFGDEDNAEPPAKLQSYDEKVRLRAIWSRDTGAGTRDQFVKLVPSVFGKHVYVADRSGSVQAIELESGKEIWSTKTKLALSAGPGVGDELVLVASSDAELVALDRDSGEQRWRTLVSSEVLSVPLVYEDVVLVQTVDGNIAGLDAQTGERLWIHDRTVPVLTLRGTGTPLLVENVVLAGFANGKMVALDAKTGRQVWETVVAIPSGRSELQRMVDVDANAVIRDGVLYAVSFQGRLTAVDLQSGRLFWNRDMSAYAGITVDSQQVYVSDEFSEVWALDRRSGASLWKQDKLRRRALTGPAIFDAYTVVGDYEGYLHLLSRFDGSIVGRERVDSEGILVAPVALGERLLVLGTGGKLVLYRLESL